MDGKIPIAGQDRCYEGKLYWGRAFPNYLVPVSVDDSAAVTFDDSIAKGREVAEDLSQKLSETFGRDYSVHESFSICYPNKNGRRVPNSGANWKILRTYMSDLEIFREPYLEVVCDDRKPEYVAIIAEPAGMVYRDQKFEEIVGMLAKEFGSSLSQEQE